MTATPQTDQAPTSNYIDDWCCQCGEGLPYSHRRPDGRWCFLAVHRKTGANLK